MTLGGGDSSKYTSTPTKNPVSKPGYCQDLPDGMFVNGIDMAVDMAMDKGQAAINPGISIILASSCAAIDILGRVLGSISIPIELLDIGVEPILYTYPC